MTFLAALPRVQAGVNALGSFMGSNSAANANRTNVKLQREQQAWEERMSNTAVLRRRRDIELAGGNPALAFTNGAEASTPNVAPAKVDPIPYNAPDISSAKLMQKQMQKMDAEIGLTTAQQDVAGATAANIRQQTLTGANTAAQTAQQTKNLEQQLENLKAELKGKLSANELAAITAGIAGKTQADQVAIVQQNLRRARAEATSAEKRALLDQAIIDTVEWAKQLANKLARPNLSTGKSWIKQGGGHKTLPNKPLKQSDGSFGGY